MIILAAVSIILVSLLLGLTAGVVIGWRHHAILSERARWLAYRHFLDMEHKINQQHVEFLYKWHEQIRKCGPLWESKEDEWIPTGLKQ